MNTSHIDALKTRHARIDATIVHEETRPLPDQATIARLKREKLRIKDELARH